MDSRLDRFTRFWLNPYPLGACVAELSTKRDPRKSKNLKIETKKITSLLILIMGSNIHYLSDSQSTSSTSTSVSTTGISAAVANISINGSSNTLTMNLIQPSSRTESTGHRHHPSTNSALGNVSSHQHAPQFPFHNPFDFSSYPITNPPIIDSTMLLPYTNEGIPRRRRISISNGQIGQIVNHEAFFDPEPASAIDDFGLNHQHFNSFHTVPQSQLPNQQVVNVANNYTSGNIADCVTPPIPSHGNMATYQLLQQYQNQQIQAQPHGSQDQAQDESQPFTHVLKQEHQKFQPDNFATSGLLQFSTTVEAASQSQRPSSVLALKEDRDNNNVDNSSFANAAGVPPPNHQLIYNNEVIYNPNNGPIPGTAAWKKERLLERNRIAASKCRQRKKQAQIQLQNNFSKYEQEIIDLDNKVKKSEKIWAFYNSHLIAFFESGDISNLNILKKYVNRESIDEVDSDDLG